MRLFWITVTYETYTEESLNDGGTADNGFVDAAADPFEVPREKTDMSFKHSLEDSPPELILERDIRRFFTSLEDLAEYLTRNNFWRGEGDPFEWDPEEDEFPPRDLVLVRSQEPDYIPAEADNDAAIEMQLHFGNLTGPEILEVLKLAGLED